MTSGGITTGAQQVFSQLLKHHSFQRLFSSFRTAAFGLKSRVFLLPCTRGHSSPFPEFCQMAFCFCYKIKTYNCHNQKCKAIHSPLSTIIPAHRHSTTVREKFLDPIYVIIGGTTASEIARSRSGMSVRTCGK